MKRSHDKLWIKRLIWTYFFLLIFEGALRKWVVPSAANALLIIRDPVVLAAYCLAWRSGLFPRNAFITAAAMIALASLTVGMLVSTESPAIAIYGFRTNFFQLPFIFLIPKAFDSRDVERIGYWTLLLAVPMGALMVLQFLAPPQSFINSGSDDSFGQIASAMGRIRPPGTFSFITGPVYFYAMVAVFLLYNQFGKKYPAWLMVAATLATLSAMAVSGSRSLVGSIGIVFVFGLLSSAMLRPAMGLRWVGGLIVVGTAAFFLSKLSILEMGLTVFSQRVTNASGTEGGALGLLARATSGFTGFVPALYDAPLLGQGLGMGTNVGLVLMADKSKFIWFEDEWARNILESGPLLGGLFIFYRIALTTWLGSVAWRHAAKRDPLPILLFGVCVTLLLNGIIGQSTLLGFAILTSGLCLAAMRVPAPVSAKAKANSEADEIAASEPAFVVPA